MIQRFSLTNFKSFAKADFDPAPVNVLVGPNNAGKSNLCQALRFLSLAASPKFNLDEAATECGLDYWNLINVYSDNPICKFDLNVRLDVPEIEATLKVSPTVDFNYSFTLSKNPNNIGISKESLLVNNEKLLVNYGGHINHLLFENSEYYNKLFDNSRFSIQNTPTGIVSVEYLDTIKTPVVNSFLESLLSWRHYFLSPSNMRSHAAVSMDRDLKFNGSNLSSVLCTFKSEHPREFDVLRDLVKKIEPKMDYISFQAPDPQNVYLFFEDRKGNKFGINALSDGTLVYMALAYIVISASADSGSSPAIVMIEEPENNLYVGYLKGLLELIDDASTKTQFVFTSHNPYFIDLFDSKLDGVHVVKNSDKGSVISKPDREKMQKFLHDFSLGEIHFRQLWE